MTQYSLRKSPHGTWDVLAAISGESHYAIRHHESWTDAARTLEVWSTINPPSVFMLVLLERSFRVVSLDIMKGVAA